MIVVGENQCWRQARAAPRTALALALALATSVSAADLRTATKSLQPENSRRGSPAFSAERLSGVGVAGRETRWGFFPLSRQLAVDESIFGYVKRAAGTSDEAIRQYAHGPRGLLVSTTEPTGGIFTYGWDGLGRLTSITPLSLPKIGSRPPRAKFCHQSEPDAGVQRRPADLFGLKGPER